MDDDYLFPNFYNAFQLQWQQRNNWHSYCILVKSYLSDVGKRSVCPHRCGFNTFDEWSLAGQNAEVSVADSQ